MKPKLNRLFVFCGCITALLLTVGCGSTRYSPRPIVMTTSDYAETWRERMDWYSFRYDAVINPYTYNPAAARDAKDPRRIKDRQDSYYSKAVNSTEPQDRMRYRNLLLDAMIGVSKESTEKHLGKVRATDDTGNLLLGGAAIGTAGAASVAAPAAATALAASSSGLGGFRGLYNEQYFKNTVMEAVNAAIHGDRESYLTIIRARQMLDSMEYNVDAAIQDALEYHRRGSYTHGLTLLRQAVQTETKANEKEAEEKARKTLEPPTP